MYENLKEYSEVCSIFLKQNKRKESGDGEINGNAWRNDGSTESMHV